MSEEEKLEKNYIPRGNVLARTPPKTERKLHLERSLSLELRKQERKTLKESYEQEKQKIDLELQKRIENASHKVDTGLRTKAPTPVKRKRTANKGIQVKFVDQEKLPSIVKKSKSLKRSNSIQSIDDITIEEFVLEMVYLIFFRGGASEAGGASGAPSCSAFLWCNWGKFVKMGASEVSH